MMESVVGGAHFTGIFLDYMDIQMRQNLKQAMGVILVLSSALLTACLGGSRPVSGPVAEIGRGSSTLTLEHHSLRVPLAVGKDGFARLTGGRQLLGKIDLGPIFAAEELPLTQAATRNIQLLIHFGRFYVVADGFRSVWELTPEAGTSIAFFREIPLVRDPDAPPLTDVRISRFGPADSACVRIDRAEGDTVFIDVEGNTQPNCP
ncbi:MAG: hypothetical protein O6947_01920 [Acidobacteria bacterium]|nr:hypothetical protein [Acidobacteriota bacterium]